MLISPRTGHTRQSSRVVQKLRTTGALAASLMASLGTAHGVSITTQHNDTGRSGANLQETALTPAAINVNTFGRAFSCPADGDIYAQPLYMPSVVIGGIRHNIIYFATMHNSVYAYDADRGTLLWQQTYGNPIPIGDVQYISDISTELGILGTPVIDPVTQYMYFVAANKDADNTYHNRVHVVSILTGLDVVPAADIQAKVPGTGDDTFTDGNGKAWVPFNAMRHNQRPGMLLLPDPRSKSADPVLKAKYANTKVVYIAWASHNDIRPYHGWLMGYEIDPVSGQLVQTGVYNSTPNGTEGGIWQSGQGPTADDQGNIYVMTGNGTSNIFQANGTEMSEAFVKLTPSPVDASLAVTDWFMPYNFDGLNGADADLGSAGVLLLPGTNFIVGGGKQSVLYVLDRSHLGGYTAGTDNVHQEFQGGVRHIHGSPVYYNSPVAGPLIYVWSEYDHLQAYHYNAGTGFFDTTPYSTSPEKVPDGMPGAQLSITANGNANGTGLLWATMPYAGDANNAVVPGVLRVYDANNLSQELWDSHRRPSDDFGNVAKFTPVTVANGKVYVATFSKQLMVYGPLRAASTAPTAPVLNAITPGDTRLLLSWSAVSGATSYRLYRSTFSQGEGNAPIATDLTTTTYTDSGLQNGKTYFYKVTAYNTKGESIFSNEVSGAPATAPVGTGTGLLAQYYTNIGLSGTPALQRVEDTVNYNYNGASPGPGVPATNWSARWAGSLQPQYTETYTISATADDGVRVFLGGKLIIDAWRDQGPTTYTATVPLTVGQTYPIEVQYYQGGGGSVMVLNWASLRTPQQAIPKTQLYPADANPVVTVGTGNGLLGQYFTNPTLTGADSAEHVDPTINFNWNGGSPIAGIPATNWSSRWTGTIVPQYTEPYTLYLTGDDGIRLYINNTKVIDAWIPQGPTEYTATFQAKANQSYGIRIEYFQNGGGSVCALNWSSIHQSKQVVPQTQLYAAPTAPINLTATPGAHSVTLTWQSTTGSRSSFAVYRGTALGAEGAIPILNRVSGTSVVDTTAVTGTKYYYYMTTSGPGGESPRSNEASATPN